ncbi:50S ribosomal protein L5 [Patescibacteria group bacterium]|nr:50S ribosomal protein L5 [Patescibacteria group bacterium]
MNKLKEQYIKKVIPAMKEKFGYKNDLAVPSMTKVTINSGVGQALKDDKFIDMVVSTLTRITGQKPVLTKAKKSISAFKIRAGMTVGAMVVLRGGRMYDFIDKLVNVSLPRVRDFQGLERKSVDQSGNLTIGFKENVMFPEIKSDEVERIHGLEISITSNAESYDQGVELFSLLGFPLKKK